MAAPLDPLVRDGGVHGQQERHVRGGEHPVGQAGAALGPVQPLGTGSLGMRADARVLADGVPVHDRDFARDRAAQQGAQDREPAQHRLDEEHRLATEQVLTVAPAQRRGEAAEPAAAAGVAPVRRRQAPGGQGGRQLVGLGGLAGAVDADQRHRAQRADGGDRVVLDRVLIVESRAGGTEFRDHTHQRYPGQSRSVPARAVLLV